MVFLNARLPRCGGLFSDEGAEVNAPQRRSVVESPSGAEVGTPLAATPYGNKEVEILMSCARLQLEEKDIRRIRQLVGQEPDWDRLILLAVFHRLTAFVVQNLTAAAADIVPVRTLEILRTRFIQDGATALRQTAELLEILRLFREARIYAIPYKGPVLAAYVYGNLAYRRCMDLDVLISRQDVPRARDLLEKSGYVPRHSMSPAGREFLLNHRHSEIFERPSSPVLELHWAFAKQRGMFAMGVEELRPRLGTRNVGGVAVPVLNPEDLLLVLCVHGANHLWSRLEWLCSVAELLKKEPLNWSEAMRYATDYHVEKYVILGTLLAHDLLGAPIPESVLDRARSDRSIVRLASIVGQKLAAADVEHAETLNSVERDLFRLRLQSTTKDRLRYLSHRLTTPSREDTRLMVPLGRGTVPLPAILRPFHVLGVLIAGIFRPADPKKRYPQRKK